MGVYLSSPITEKVSSDETCPNFSYGASSMQGWRMSQEDAHNCIQDFDPATETSFFAVYDGHGGAEVAKYCAEHLPGYVKGHILYNNGELEEALKEAFLGFDETLTRDEVIKELKVLAGMDDDEEEEEEADPVYRSEADVLRAEADMPIEDLLARYDGMVGGVPQVRKLGGKDEKFLSPVIHAKRSPCQEGESGLRNVSNNASDLTDCIVARLEDKLVTNGHADNENNLNAEKELLAAESTSSESDAVKLEKSESSTDRNSDRVEKSGLLPDSSSGKSSVSQEAEDKKLRDSIVGEKADVMEADSTSDGQSSSHNGSGSGVESEPSIQKTVELDSEAQSSSVVSNSQAEATQSRETSSSVVVVSSSSSNAASSSTCITTTACFDEVPGPSGSGAASSSSSTSSSAVAGSSSDAGPSSSSQGPSGSGLGSSSKTVLTDEDFDSEEEDSSEDEDEEYIEDSEEEEEDEEEDELEDEEEEEEVLPIDDQSGTGEPGLDSGCTAVVALVRKNKVVVANAGDSRCVLCRAGKAVELSFDHKPEDEPERARIEAAGGKVTGDGRVNGGLNLSRAIGDHCYKKNQSLPAKDQMISAYPDIETETLGEDDEFLVLACDGIWNFMTSQEVVDFVRERLKDPEKRKKLSLICEEMFDHCLAPNTMGDGTGCDNMTCMVIVFSASSKNKRHSSDLEPAEAEDKQPEKRAKLEENEKEPTTVT